MQVQTNRTISPAGNIPSVRTLYDGWLKVERSTSQTMDKYVTESLVCFPGGWVETRQFSWSNPLKSICSTTDRCYFLNLSLAGWDTGGLVRNLRPARDCEVGPIRRMFMVPPEQTMQFNSLEGRSRSIRCMLDAKLFEPFPMELPNWSEDEGSIRSAFHIGGGQIEWLLRRMHQELQEPDFATPQMLEALAKQLTVEIVRALKQHRKNADRYVGGLAPWRLRLIRGRLQTEKPLPGVDELAELCDMTVRHLSRAFRTENGQTIGKYIESAMVDRANRMLRAGSPVGKVARSLGYSTSGSFATAFRRATGLLPSQIGDKDRH